MLRKGRSWADTCLGGAWPGEGAPSLADVVALVTCPGGRSLGVAAAG